MSLDALVDGVAQTLPLADELIRSLKPDMFMPVEEVVLGQWKVSTAVPDPGGRKSNGPLEYVEKIHRLKQTLSPTSQKKALKSEEILRNYPKF